MCPREEIRPPPSAVHSLPHQRLADRFTDSGLVRSGRGGGHICAPGLSQGAAGTRPGGRTSPCPRPQAIPLGSRLGTASLPCRFVHVMPPSTWPGPGDRRSGGLAAAHLAAVSRPLLRIFVCLVLLGLYGLITHTMCTRTVYSFLRHAARRRDRNSSHSGFAARPGDRALSTQGDSWPVQLGDDDTADWELVTAAGGECSVFLSPGIRVCQRLWGPPVACGRDVPA